MLNNLRQFIGVLLYTVRINSRRPLFLLLTGLTLLLVLLLPSMVTFNLGDSNRLVRDGALALLAMSGMLFAMAAPAVLAYDPSFKGGTGLALCSPVSRFTLFLGRYAGVTVSVLWHSSIILTGCLLAERISVLAPDFDLRALGVVLTSLVLVCLFAVWANYHRRASFAGTAMLLLLPAICLALMLVARMHPDGGWCGFGAFMEWRFLPVGFLIVMAVVLMTSWAYALTLRLPLPAAVSGFLLVLLIGALLDYFIQRTPPILSVLLRLFPAWQDFWAVECLASGGAVSLNYALAAFVYVILYSIALLAGALGLFLRWEQDR